MTTVRIFPPRLAACLAFRFALGWWVAGGLLLSTAAEATPGGHVASAAAVTVGAAPSGAQARSPRAKSPARSSRAKPSRGKASAAKPTRAAATPGDAGGQGGADDPKGLPATATPAEGAPLVQAEESQDGVKTYTFGAQEVEGRLRSPQILYFLRRVRAEFDPRPLGHRSFLLELSDTRRHRALP